MRFLVSDGYMFHSNLDMQVPGDVTEYQITEKPVKGSIRGDSLEFMVSVDFARKVCDLWGMKIEKMEPVYYPYWLVKHKDRKLLIDALNAKLDSELSESIQKML